MSADPMPFQMKYPAFVRFGVPIVCGIAIDYGSDLVKVVTRYATMDLPFYVQQHVFHLDDVWDLLLGLVFCVTTITVGTLAIEKWGDPRPAVRTALLIGSLTIVGMFFHPFPCK